jgi:hypothetical protein
MDNRISDLKAMATHHPLVADLTDEVSLGAAALADLEEPSPTTNAWVPLAGGARRPWTAL